MKDELQFNKIIALEKEIEELKEEIEDLEDDLKDSKQEGLCLNNY